MAPLREPHGGDVSVGCGCTGASSSFRCRCSWPRFSTTPPQGDRRRPRTGREARVALHGQVTEAPLSQGGQPAPLSEVAGWQSRVRGTPWTRSSTPFLGYRRSMVLCRLWWNSWWTCSSSLTRSFLLPSRLSTCPRSSLSASRREPRFASRSWRNNLWKYRRSCHFPRCSGLWNRPWTFQLLVDVVIVEVCKIFPGPSSTAAADVGIPVLRGDLQGFLPGQGSTASSSHSVASDEASQGVFRTFLHGEKCGVPGRSVRTSPGTSAHGPRRLMCSPGGSMRSSWRRRRRRTRATFRLSVLPFLLPTAPGHCVQSACGWGRHQRGRWKDVYLPVFSFGAGGGLPCLLLRQGARCLWLDEGHP